MRSAAEVEHLVEQALAAVADEQTRAVIASLRVAPLLQLRGLAEGSAGARHRTWLVAQSPHHPIGLAWAETGGDPTTPWGFVSINHLSLGVPQQWYTSLESAYWASDIQHGASQYDPRAEPSGGSLPASALAAAYLKHLRTRAPEDAWAFHEVLNQITTASVDDGWELIEALLDTAHDEELGYIGAGPLEDFVRCHAEKHWRRIEKRAIKDPTFRACLGTICLSREDLSPEVLERVVRASGNGIVTLDARSPDL